MVNSLVDVGTEQEAERLNDDEIMDWQGGLPG
jgi:hypothetical protein